MPIQWYPGHMAKAKREISEALKNVDIVLELRDARIPLASKNPMVDEIVGQKPRLILLNKSNMADKKATMEWIKYYKNQGIIALDVDSIDKYNIDKVYPYVKLVLKDYIKHEEDRGISNVNIRGLIIGIPNVGKSTFINLLAGRKIAVTGDKPGVTKMNLWININPYFKIMDTPGILWPKFEDQEIGYKLAICGSIKDEILELEGIAFKAVEYMKELYPNLIASRYSLDEESIRNMEAIDVLDAIGEKRGCLLKMGQIDYNRACKLIINDIRSMKIGAMTFERPIGNN